MMGVLAVHTCNHHTSNVITKTTTDTLIITKYDTIRDTIPQVVMHRVVDTITVQTQDSTTSVQLPIEQKHYSKPSLYDVWVSGYQPRLDSVKMYNKMVYGTITNEVVREVKKRRLGIYPYVGVNVLNEHVGGKIGIMLTTKGSWAFGGEVGVMNDKVYYGINIGCKIN